MKHKNIRRKMKKLLVEEIIPWWLLVNFLLLLLGAFQQHADFQRSCDGPLSRGSYVFPGHALGCWLVKAPGAR